MRNPRIKPRINASVGEKVIIGMCRWDGKYGYYISQCTQTTPYSKEPENMIKIEFPDKGVYGYKMVRADGGVSNIVSFLFRDFAIRTSNLEEIAIIGHCEKGEEYKEERGQGWCKYTCIHKPLDKKQYNKIMAQFNKLKYFLKTGKAENIQDYLRNNVISD